MAAINFGYTISKPRAIDIDRKVHTLVRRGEYQGAYEEMNKCMLCGKCRLVCPRGINTRGVVMLIKRKLGDF